VKITLKFGDLLYLEIIVVLQISISLDKRQTFSIHKRKWMEKIWIRREKEDYFLRMTFKYLYPLMKLIRLLIGESYDLLSNSE